MCKPQPKPLPPGDGLPEVDVPLTPTVAEPIASDAGDASVPGTGDPMASGGSPFTPRGDIVGDSPVADDSPDRRLLAAELPLGCAIWIVLLGTAVFNLFAPLVLIESRSVFVIVPLMVVLLSQPQAIAFWGVFGPRSFPVRWVQAAAAGALLALALMLPLQFQHVGPTVANIPALLCLIPAGALLVQIPFWVLRAAGFRLVGVRRGDDQSLDSPHQFTIRDLLTLTVVVAVSLGLARLGIQQLSDGGFVVDGPGETGVMGAVIILVWEWVVTLLATMPCLAAALIARSRLAGLLGLAAYIVVLVLIVVCVMVAVSGGFGLPPGGAVLRMLSSMASLFPVPYVGFSLLRSMGVRMERRGRAARAGSPFGASPFGEPAIALHDDPAESPGSPPNG